MAHIEAEVAPDASGPLLDRLKQLGRVGRLEISRKQATAEGAPPIPGAKVEPQGDAAGRVALQPGEHRARVSSSLNLATDDVEKAFRSIVDQVTSAGGRAS